MGQSSALTIARRKKSDGQPLSAEEERVFRAYVRKFVKLSLKVRHEILRP